MRRCRKCKHSACSCKTKTPDRYEIEERAAILEFDAGLSREEADWEAQEMLGYRERISEKEALEISEMQLPLL